MGLSHSVNCKVRERYGSPQCKVGVCSMQGYRVSMEDDHRVVMQLPNAPNTGLFGVFDGHGGDQASKFCAQKIHKRVQEIANRDYNQETLSRVLLDVDAEFLDESNPNRAHGSTCVFALVNYDGFPNNMGSDKYTVTVSNSGDSRCVRGTLREGESSYTMVTEDHKPTDEIERNRILKANGFVTNGRVDGDLSVSRAVGDWQFKTNPDIHLSEQKVSPVPDVTSYTVQKGDWLLLACDGIYERLETNDVVNFVNTSLRETNDPAVTASDLIMYSLQAGSKDNMSVVLIQFEDGTDYVPSEFTEGYERSFVHSELFPEDSSFMNAYRKFAIENGFESEVSSEEFMPSANANSSADTPPILQLLAQLANGKGNMAAAAEDLGITFSTEEEDEPAEN